MRIVKAKPTTLAAPLASNDTSFTLDSFVDSKGNALALSSFGSFVVVVLKQGNIVEMVKCSAITQNASGSATFAVATNGRDLNPTSPYAGSATGEDFQTGADALVTNDPYTMSFFAVLENDQTFTGANTFSQKLGVGAVTSSDLGKAATVDLLNATTAAGAPNASDTVIGIARLSVYPNAPSLPIAVGSNDPRMPQQYQTDALVGTSGTPGASNPYVTRLDRSGSNIPAGVYFPYGGLAAPAGFLLCDGSAVSRTTYAALFSAISTWFGSGDGTTTFNVPNLKGRVVVGYDATQTEFDTIGESGGEKTHTLTVSEMPSHDHTGTYPSESDSNGSLPAGSNVSTTNASNPYATVRTGNVVAQGGGVAHNNLQPYGTGNYIIKY